MQSKETPARSAVLLLDDGTVFHGKAAGAIGTATGEIAFNTGMTGYQEIFTDPSYFGQMLVMAAAHIGNYGVHPDEIESETVKISGMICKKFSDNYSRPGAETSLQEYFVRDGVVSICDVDTRALIRHIRNKGAMNAIISSEISDVEILKARLKEIPSMEGLELASKVTCNEAYEFGDSSASFRVAVLDLGVKTNSLRCLAERNCFVKVFPMSASVAEMEAWKPDGYLLSNGPGDPKSMTETIKSAGKIIETGRPVFGICLGHQILAHALGGSTFKLKFGHRGGNHPVKDLRTGKIAITSQNHGFAAAGESLPPQVEVTHVNLNDNTVEGLRHRDFPVFSVQYHPEAAPGPSDASYFFEEFANLIDQTR